MGQIATLLAHLAQVAGERFQLEPAASEEQVTFSEGILGFRLPDALRTFYLVAGNGGSIPEVGCRNEMGGRALFYGVQGGYAYEQEYIHDLYRFLRDEGFHRYEYGVETSYYFRDQIIRGWPEKLLPVGLWGCFGSKFSLCLDCSTPEAAVYYFDIEALDFYDPYFPGAIALICNSFEEFLASILTVKKPYRRFLYDGWSDARVYVERQIAPLIPEPQIPRLVPVANGTSELLLDKDIIDGLRTHPDVHLEPRATEQGVAFSERVMGFHLPDELRSFYTEVGNGGFFPNGAYLAGVRGRYDDLEALRSDGENMHDFYRFAIYPRRPGEDRPASDDPEDETLYFFRNTIIRGWPDRLLPIGSWGDPAGTYSIYVDCTTPDLPVFWFDSAGENPNNIAYPNPITLVFDSFAAFLRALLTEEDPWRDAAKRIQADKLFVETHIEPWEPDESWKMRSSQTYSDADLSDEDIPDPFEE
jgi:hypothetical protein